MLTSRASHNAALRVIQPRALRGCAVCVLLMLSLCATVSHAQTAAPAQSIAIPASWADPVQTRALEELLHNAIQEGKAGSLSAAYADIQAYDQPVFAAIDALNQSGNQEALASVAFRMSACHNASMGIRMLIQRTYEQALTHNGAIRQPLPTSAAEAFADNMGLCERLKMRTTPPPQRLIGGG